MTVETIHDVMQAPFEDIEYAKVRLAKGEHTRYEGGRIIGRTPDDLILRYRGHEVRIQAYDFELVEFKPVVLEAEKKIIEREWSE